MIKQNTMNKINSTFFVVVLSLGAISCGNNKVSNAEGEGGNSSAATVLVEESSIELEKLAEPDSTSYTTTSRGSSSRKFEKTRARCSKCGCTGYWGYKHQNGTYEGNCSNSDGHGHTSNHGPEKHGLKKW